MALKLYNENDITDVASAIREKSGSMHTYTVAQMPEAIRAISTEEKIVHADIPQYVKTAVCELATKVRSVQTEKTITFLAMSDSHYYGNQGSAGVDSYTDSNGTQGNISNLHAAMAAKALVYILDIDFLAHLGDQTWGSKTTTPALLESQVGTLSGYLGEAYKGLPNFCVIGNHDTGIYYHDAQVAAGKSGVFTQSGKWLCDNFTSRAPEGSVIAGQNYGGYLYCDFADKKLRVFQLNTSERHVYDQTDNATLGSQRIWLAKALEDLNSKSDSASWSFLLLSHYPADYGATMPLSELLKAYVEGGSIAISHENGSSYTANFAGKNGAKLIAQFHGHVHNFKVGKLNSYATGKAKTYDAWRVCIPNAQYNRENYYSTVGSYTDIDFSESDGYPKTPDTAKDTSFVVNVIDPEKQLIHSFVYGAGYDRIISYGAAVYYSVSKTLTACSIDNDATSVEQGTLYEAQITANDKYTLSTVKITMGGIDVTSAAYSSGRISIEKVTGDIVITAVATKPITYTNLVPTSIDNTGEVYNDTGYKNGYCLNSSGGENSDMGKFTVTGFIPVDLKWTEDKTDNVLRIGGSAQVANYSDYGWRISGYDAAYGHVKTIAFSGMAANITVSNGVLALADIDNYFGTNANIAFIRISCATGTSTATVNGAELVVTLNEEID